MTGAEARQCASRPPAREADVAQWGRPTAFPERRKSGICFHQTARQTTKLFGPRAHGSIASAEVSAPVARSGGMFPWAGSA